MISFQVGEDRRITLSAANMCVIAELTEEVDEDEMPEVIAEAHLTPRELVDAIFETD